MSKEFIKIGGAREHNLKNLTLEIPRDKLVVISGLSGSGKPSLAFDTIYAEGQRKYVESLSAKMNHCNLKGIRRTADCNADKVPPTPWLLRSEPN